MAVLDQGELERRWRAKWRAYFDSLPEPTWSMSRAVERWDEACRPEPMVPCPACLRRPATTSSGLCSSCARERGLATNRARPLRAEDEPITVRQMAAEDAEPWTDDERWALAYVHHRLPTLPTCSRCHRLLFSAQCWHCEEARQRTADERARELARKLRSWRKHEVEWSRRAKARRQARAEAAV